MPRLASFVHVPQLIAVSAACGLLALGAYVAHAPTPVPSAAIPAPQLEDTTTLAVHVPEVAVVRQPAPPPAASNQLLFVFRAGTDLYVTLSSDEPKHGKRRLIEDDGGATTVAEVAPANLPAKFRGWEHKTFALDGGCTATVRGFAVVTRMVGSPGYAGLDDETWNATTAANAGTSQLAARLAVGQGCDKALYARDASLAPIGELVELERPDLVDAARSALLASPASADAQTQWAGGEELGWVNAGSWIDSAQVTSFTVRHPKTGVIYVGLHAAIEHGCGGPDVNLWGLFRVERDGRLVTVVARQLDTLYSVDRVLDVDNDGTLELIGSDWLGLSTILTSARGEELDRLAIEFHGCPC